MQGEITLDHHSHHHARAASFIGSLAGLALLWSETSGAQPPPLEAYGRLPGVERMALSPSGEQYAFIADLGDSKKLGVLNFDSELLYQISVADLKLRGLKWAGDEHLLATFSKTVDLWRTTGFRHELDSVAVITPKEKKHFYVFSKTPSIANTVLGHHGSALIDGTWQAFFGGITYTRGSWPGDYEFTHGYPDLYRVELGAGEPTREDRGSANHAGWVLDQGGTVVAHAEYVEKSGRWRLYAGKERKKPLMEREAPLEEVSLVGMGRQPGTVLVSDATGDENVVLEISVADGREVVLFFNDSFDSLLYDPKTGLLIGATVPDSRRAIFFDPQSQANFDGTRKAFPGLEMQLLSATSGLTRLLVKTDGGDDSGTYWLVDIKAGTARPAGYAYPPIRPADVATTRLYRYKAADGLQIEAVLTEPRGSSGKALPLVVLPHGGPIGVSDRLGFDWWAQAYASRGYAVLQPNYRGSSGYGREFRSAGYGEWGGKMLTDIADGVKALAAEGRIDPGRACIVGASYGGYAALAGVTLQSGLYRCAVSVNGVSDLRDIIADRGRRYGHHSSISRYWRAATGADTNSSILREVSPVRHAKQASAPILLIHGEDDIVVPSSQSRDMASALRRADKPVELVLMKGEDHWLSRESTRVEMLRQSVEFVLRHNPPDVQGAGEAQPAISAPR